MPETLEIQIQDKSPTGSSGPPRPPRVPGASPRPDGSASPVGPRAPFGAKKAGDDPIGELAGQLGFGKLYNALQKLSAVPREVQGPAAVTQIGKEPPKLPLSGLGTMPPKAPRALAPSGHAAVPPKAPAGGAGAATAAEGAEAAAGAEVAGGALAGLAAAAGPIGAALVVADVAAGQMAKTFDNTRERIEQFGHGLASVAGNDYLGAFKQGLDAIHSPLKDIPIVGQMYESQVRAAIAPVKAFTEVVEAFNHRAGELAKFSPALAMAQGRNTVKDVFSDLREAQELGADLARMAEAQADAGRELRELLLPVKKVVVEALAGVLEALAEFLKDARVMLSKEFWEELFDDLAKAIKPNWAGGMNVPDAWAKFMAKVDDIRSKLDSEFKGEALWLDQLNANQVSDELRRSEQSRHAGLSADTGPRFPILQDRIF